MNFSQTPPFYKKRSKPHIYLFSRRETVSLQHVRQDLLAFNYSKSSRKDSLSEVCAKVFIAQPSRQQRRRATIVKGHKATYPIYHQQEKTSSEKQFNNNSMKSNIFYQQKKIHKISSVTHKRTQVKVKFSSRYFRKEKKVCIKIIPQKIFKFVA